MDQRRGAEVTVPPRKALVVAAAALGLVAVVALSSIQPGERASPVATGPDGLVLGAPARPGSSPAAAHPGGPLQLARQQWEGGPAYYERFPATVAAGWRNPRFFPIGVWFESVGSQHDVDLDKTAGINTYVELTDNSDLGLVRSNKMSVITGARAAGYGPETVGWLLDDEVDMWGGPGHDRWTGNVPGQDPLCDPASGRCGYTVLKTLSDRLPAGDGRLRYANFGKGALLWESDDEAAAFVNGYTQAVSADAYWYTDPGVCENAQNALNLPAQQCRLAANYGWNVDRLRALDALDGRLQPVFAFIEDGWPSSDGGRRIRPEELAGAVMNSLIHEARGIIYFNHSFGGPCQSQHVLRDACGAGIRPTVTELDRRVNELAPVLNTQSYAYSFNPGLDTMLKEYDESYYVFAMVKRGSPTGSYSLALPPGLVATRAAVLFENRDVPVDAAGRITDSFAAEYTYHIYKLTP